jgi:hypothetical protein
MQEENVLARIAKGPFSNFKEGGLGSILEEVMGRLRVLRRNQRVLNIKYQTTMDNYACFQLFEEYELDVVDVVNTDNLHLGKVLQENNFPTEFPLMMVDTSETWVRTEYKPLVVAIKLSEVTMGEYNKTVETSTDLGYIPVALTEGVVVSIRHDLANEAGVKGINRRNFDIVFYDK